MAGDEDPIEIDLVEFGSEPAHGELDLGDEDLGEADLTPIEEVVPDGEGWHDAPVDTIEMPIDGGIEE